MFHPGIRNAVSLFGQRGLAGGLRPVGHLAEGGEPWRGRGDKRRLSGGGQAVVQRDILRGGESPVGRDREPASGGWSGHIPDGSDGKHCGHQQRNRHRFLYADGGYENENQYPQGLQGRYDSAFKGEKNMGK